MDAKQLEKHLWNMNTQGFTLVAVCFGNELGLFDLIMEKNKPMTSLEIADFVDMRERYIREWLGCMVAAEIIQLDGDKYFIPEEHFDVIRSTTAWAYGAIAWVRRFERTKQTFYNNGPWGHDYDTDEDFWKFLGGFRKVTAEDFLTKSILPALEEEEPGFLKKLESGLLVLDIGCGSGEFTRVLASKYTKSTVKGLDFCEKPLKLAEEHSLRKGLTNLIYERGDVHNLKADWTGKYDFVTAFDCLHDLPDPKKALAEMARVLKPGGKIMIMDFSPHSEQAKNAGNMTTAMFYSCSIFSCLPNSMMVEPRIGYGTCWGEQRMTETIKEVLHVRETVHLHMMHTVFICTHKASVQQDEA